MRSQRYIEPYVGISGVMSAAEIETITTAFRPNSLPRRLAFGALVSSKTIDGGTNKYPNRYPRIDAIKDIFVKRDPFERSTFIVHYSTTDDSHLDRDLERAYLAGGVNCDGVQINCKWPDLNNVRAFACTFPNARVVLQIKPDEPLEAILLRVHAYAYTVTDVLVDGSAGKGVQLDVANTARILSALRSYFPHLGIGFAGALCADTIPLVKELLLAIPGLSTDAEGKIRDGDDHLRTDQAIAYAALTMGILMVE